METLEGKCSAVGFGLCLNGDPRSSAFMDRRVGGAGGGSALGSVLTGAQETAARRLTENPSLFLFPRSLVSSCFTESLYLSFSR